MPLNVNLLNKIIEVFTINKWEIDKNDEFKRYCELLEIMTDEQQLLILELTKNYIWLDMSRYESQAKIALSKIPVEVISSVKNIYLLPLLAPEDIGKSKSSTFVTYMLKASLQNHDVFRAKNVSFLDNPNSGLPKNLAAKSCLIMLVDDYIGTGETAESAVRYLTDELNIPKEKILVLSLVAQSTGLQKLASMGIRVVTSLERGRGISDSFPSPQKEKYLELMKEIEDEIQVEEKFRFGYNASEALITMMRTPNNTFPVFWLEHKQVVKKKRVAPFPR